MNNITNIIRYSVATLIVVLGMIIASRSGDTTAMWAGVILIWIADLHTRFDKK